MNFTTTAPDRKTLVKALAEHFEFDATYVGPPTFSYKVGDITIEDESVSRAHMHLQLNESGLVASDLQSTNGSAINGEPLTAYNSCSPVEDGDTLTLGYITLQVEFI